MMCILLWVLTAWAPPPYVIDGPHIHPEDWICRMLRWPDHRPLEG